MFHFYFVLCVLATFGQERLDLGMIIHIIMQMKKAKWRKGHLNFSLLGLQIFQVAYL